MSTPAHKFLTFVNASRSPFHAVDQAKQRLVANGFQQLSEKETWALQKSGKYFFTRNQSTIVAFCVGGKFQAGNGFKIVAAHTDSPNLKLKPVSATTKSGYLSVSAETYGGGLWFTWFDRDLTVAGRVVVKNGDKFEHRLVTIDRPIMRIPSLAIHLDREANEKFQFNKETHLAPILATQVQAQLSAPAPATAGASSTAAKERHHSALVALLASELSVEPQDILEFELSVCDTQPAAIGGLFNEFIFAPRIDNLMSSFCALESLTESSTAESLAEDTDVRVIALFDHEECGSESAQGAASSMMEDFFRRVTSVFAGEEGPRDAFEAAMKKTFLISSDMAHAIHPNYSEKHQELHRPEFHKGPVIKYNSNQRYATNALTAFVIKQLAAKNGIPVQEFIVRNDSPCGSTIGPILSARCGIRTVDIGGPQLSMHSIREMCGTADVAHSVNLLKAFFEQYRSLDESLLVE